MTDTCPYLKSGGAETTAPRPFPSHRHRCTTNSSGRLVAPKTQAHFCFDAEHVRCPYFVGAELTRGEPRLSASPSRLIRATTFLLLASLVAVAAAWAWRTQAGGQTAAAQAFTKTPPPPTATATAVPTATVLPTATSTRRPVSVPSQGAARPLADQPPDRIAIPSIGLDAPVVTVDRQIVEQDGHTVSTWEVADHAAGFHLGSAHPGRSGNTVLSAHHNVKGQVFQNLVDVPTGARVLLYVGQTVYPYVVVQQLILPDAGASIEQKEENARWIEPYPDERLTLVTCWPDDSNTHRLVVIAFPPSSEQINLDPAPHRSSG